MTNISVPPLCRERLRVEGKAYPRSSCEVCGQWSPKASECNALLSAPAAEVEGLEVVAWQDADNPLYTTAEKRVVHDWVNNGYPIVELCSLTKAQAIINQLDTRIDSLMTTFVRIVDYLGIDPEEARKQSGKPSDVFIAAIDQLKEKLAVTTDCANAYSQMFEEVSEELAALRQRVLFVLEPWADEKPRNWLTDREKLRRLHDDIKEQGR